MATTNLGKVRFHPRGAYSDVTEYSYYDWVTDSGNSYAYINPTPAAGVPLADTSHWQQIAEKGLKGEQGDPGAKGDKGDPGEVTAAELAAVTSQLAEIANGVGIESGAIDVAKTNFITTGKNIFNKYRATSGYYINQTTGQLVSSVRYMVSEIMFASHFDQFSITTEANLRMCFFDASGAFISGVLNPSNPITPPENTVYIRFSFLAENVDTMQLEKASAPTTYESFRYVISGKMQITDVFETVDILLPPTIYAVVGHETNIYFNNIVDVHNLDNYQVDVTCTKGKQQRERWTFKPVSDDVGTTTIKIDVYKNNVLVGSKTANLIIVAENAGTGVTKNVCIIGDSTGASQYNVPTIATLFAGDAMTVNLIGTQGTAPAKHECRSGWSALTYVSAGSPFYFSGVNFSQYLSTNSLATPDIVHINLGINDVFTATETNLESTISSMITRYNTLITSIKAANANVIIGIGITIPSGEQDAFAAYGCGMTAWKYRMYNRRVMRRLIDSFGGKETSDKIYLVPLNVCLDTVNNQLFADAEPINSRNPATIQRATNGVHPGEYGYYQLADANYYFTKYIGSL